MAVYSNFLSRHLGAIGEERQQMLQEIGYDSLDSLMTDIVPGEIRLKELLDLPAALSEHDALARLKGIMSKNVIKKSLIGQGFNSVLVPNVIIRNILENPGWYTAYTPYQPEIAQGRLEVLMAFQTMIVGLTGLDVANASLLDEASAAAEAMTLCRAQKGKGNVFFVANTCHPQTIDVLMTRAEPLGIEVLVGDWKTFDPAACEGLFGVLVQYPDTFGSVEDYSAFFAAVHATKSFCCVAADLLSLCVLREPGSFGADICIGTTQRFGVPMGFGGPHAAYMSCTDALKRKMPGRLIGKSVDTHGRPGYRLSLQTREQHIRREKATSNVCTAQVLTAILATMYVIYHGQEGMKEISASMHRKAVALATALKEAGYTLVSDCFYDTITVNAPGKADAIVKKACELGYNLRAVDADCVGVAMGECINACDLANVLTAFDVTVDAAVLAADVEGAEEVWEESFDRTSEFLTEKVFNTYHSETDMMRYIKHLESRDLALNEAMIPLGSCTMKLNAASEMIPMTWPEATQMHPFAPADQTLGYREMLSELETWLASITGFDATSLQPLSGAHGEYAGLIAIRRYQKSIGEDHRNICLIPTSAHGTNPASSAMAGLKLVTVKCDELGNIDLADLKEKAEAHAADLSCIMVTYPSTHGVYEQSVEKLCQIIHANGGQVYMDGANMNAQVGLTNPGTIGADVCHLNLHKTFALPHGGGGPGIGSISVAAHLAPYLPGHETLGHSTGAVSSAAWGNACSAPIAWMYIALMGPDGLKEASETAILAANYVAQKLNGYYPVLYSGNKGLVAHECIIDIKPLIQLAGITIDDVAKRLMDYGFHGPTMSFPVHDTLMVEPTESEPKRELDRFIEAMRSIHAEIMEIAEGKADPTDNVLHNAPHTAEAVSADEWTHPYSRAKAAYPVEGLRQHKFWPYTGRIDNVYGDRNLVCTCDPVSEWE